MSRFEGHFDASGATPVESDELARLLAGNAPTSTRKQAIACYLSASEGWNDALATLGGTFAKPARIRLTNGKE
ncbi:hypothetical protein [Sphingomonas sp.]|uniref:hypothetical protein n=1 Tax=Sphingomonas sp. TaxID=28214 RepID=UPI00286D2354|nr:hypothetical protein [Sphingomonas sp.]